MDLSPVVIAIPMYFTLMGVELVAESLNRKRTYRLNDAMTNISAGTLQQVSATFLEILKIGVYTSVYTYASFWHLERSWLNFALLFVLWDLCYYWDHRFQHVISLFWGGHSVHHQSEEYNLSVALRQSSTSVLWGFPIYLPLALLGFHPVSFAIVGGLNLLYQFWIHTEHINRLPAWFELVFNTPSHHRVHHGRDPKYLDKNYAGVFIIWDRLFGTFKAEEERPHYGVTKPLHSWNPVFANVAHYVDLWQALRRVRSWKDALRILFYPPGWYPEYLGGFQHPQPVGAEYQKYDAHPPVKGINAYMLVQFLGALAINSFFLFRHASFDPLTKVLFALWIVLTSLIFGWLFESTNRRVAILENLRLLSIPLGLAALAALPYGLPNWAPLVGLVFSGVSLLAFGGLMQQVRRLATPG